MGFHMTPAAPSQSVGARIGVFHVPVACQVQGCLHSCTGALGSSPAVDITPGDDAAAAAAVAGSQCPSRGYNILDYGRECSCFANIPRMEEISDQCSWTPSNTSS